MYLSLKNDFSRIVPHFIQSVPFDPIGPQIVDLVHDQLTYLTARRINSNLITAVIYAKTTKLPSD